MKVIIGSIMILGFAFTLPTQKESKIETSKANTMTNASETDTIVKVTKTVDEWRKQLSPEAFYVLREQGTETPFKGAYWNNHAKGTYVCGACDLPLFDSETKFDSGTGWPSFYKPIKNSHVTSNLDKAHGLIRTEVECVRCGGH